MELDIHKSPSSMKVAEQEQEKVATKEDSSHVKTFAGRKVSKRIRTNESNDTPRLKRQKKELNPLILPCSSSSEDADLIKKEKRRLSNVDSARRSRENKKMELYKATSENKEMRKLVDTYKINYAENVVKLVELKKQLDLKDHKIAELEEKLEKKQEEYRELEKDFIELELFSQSKSQK